MVSFSQTNKWTEIVTNKRQQDPFAGMKSSVDYEQEIERLKQLVPKMMDNSKRNQYKKYHPHNQPQQQQQQQHQAYIPLNSKSHHHSYQHPASTISRSTSPDSYSTSSSISSDQMVSEEEKFRFLAFVRSWAGDFSTLNNEQEFYHSSYSLWSTSSNHQQPHINYYTYWQQPSHTPQKLPIGMGRRKK